LLSGASMTCTVNLAGAASTAATITLSSSGAAVTLPASVTIAQGASSGTFTITGGGVTANSPVTLTASVNGTSGTASLTVTASPTAPAMSSLSCGSSTLLSGANLTCTVNLAAAASTAVSITLSSNNAAVMVPASVAIPAGAATGAFVITGGSSSAKEVATLSAALGGNQLSVSITLVPATSPRFYLTGTSSEVSGTANGSAVTPNLGPAGTVVVNGAGSIQFAPAANGGGVSFHKGGQQNLNTAFYTFAGPQVQQIFNPSQGEVTFNLTSAYSFAQRAALPQYNTRVVFDVYDNSNERFFFSVQAGTALVFSYMTGGTASQTYIVPDGTEDALFGNGVILNVKLVWNGSKNDLYLNGQLVKTIQYTGAAANWTNLSSFSIGAGDVHVYGGGFFSCDDVISGFMVQNQ
jgi:hypothetical protein